MRIPPWTQPRREQHPKVEDWLEDYLKEVFRQIDDLTRAATARLDFGANFKSVIREVALKSGVPARLKLQGPEWKPIGVLAVGETIYYRKLKWSLASLSEVDVTVKFEADDGTEPTGEVPTRLLIFGS